MLSFITASQLSSFQLPVLSLQRRLLAAGSWQLAAGAYFFPLPAPWRPASTASPPAARQSSSPSIALRTTMIAARRARDGAAHDEQVVLGVNLHDLQVAHGHAVAAHAPRRAHALDDARRERRGADRARRPVEHRAVGRRAAAEVMALHDALEALAAADADHVDAVAVGEDAGHEHLVAGLQRLGALGQLHFAADARRRHAGLLVVPRRAACARAPAAPRPARSAPPRSRRWPRPWPARPRTDPP